MNYLAEILAFNNWIEYNSSISKSDICLWHALMAIANRLNWENEFNVPISTLISKSKLNRNDVYKSRNKLKQFGLIDFKERGGNKSSIYKINSFASLFGTQAGTQVSTQTDTQISTQSGTQIGHIHKTKNLKLETKNKKEREKVFSDNSFDELIDDYTQNEQLRFELKEHLRTRKAKKSALTTHAIELSLRKLDTLASNDEEKIEIVQNAIERGYTGFFPLPDVKKTGVGNQKKREKLIKYTNYDSMDPNDWV